MGLERLDRRETHILYSQHLERMGLPNKGDLHTVLKPPMLGVKELKQLKGTRL